jgi:hypothetical protein
MRRCRTCLYPDTKPDLYFDETGQCSACINYARRPTVDWDARKDELVKLLDRFDGRCIVPSSGGKDSTYQVLTLLEMGADVTIVTARTCHLTEIGRKNIDNLARYARTIEVVPNMNVRAKLNRLGLEQVGDISWPEHAAIFSTPFRAAVDLKIPLIMYGECPQAEYGGPMGSEQALQMTRRWRSEFGGFLGLRPADFVGVEGITARDMADYELPAEMYCEAHFLGQYLPWDSHRNADVAIDAGMIVGREVHNDFGIIDVPPTKSNWWAAENLDNAQTGLHDYLGFRKYGYGRGCAQISIDVRAGGLRRECAVDWIKTHDGIFPEVYAGVPVDEVLDRIGMTRQHLYRVMDQFTNWSIFRRVEDDAAAMPILVA